MGWAGLGAWPRVLNRPEKWAEQSISNHYAFEVMYFRQIANPQMKMARLKSGDLQPLCKMPSPSSFFFPEFFSRHSFPRGQSIPRQTARRRLPFTNSRAKQSRSTDLELCSSSFPFAVPISRSVSSRLPYQFVVCWPSVHRRTGSPLGSSTDLHQVLSRAASSYCALLRPNAHAKLAKEDARCFSYRAKWWRREGKPREGKKKAREVEPRIP